MKFDIIRMIEQDAQSEWYMPGTEGTGEYIVVANSDLGRVGFRCTGGIVRVRVEPVNSTAAEKLSATFPVNGGWKQPRILGQYRFSKVFTDPSAAIMAVEGAIGALGKGLDKGCKKRLGGYSRFWRMAIRQHLPAQVASAA
jgi:hypothetical protein